MSKKLSPGRIYKIEDTIVRAKRQFDCKGCIFDNPFACPRIKDIKDRSKEIISCIEDGVIFISPKKNGET